jgi:hypothetical protein
MGKHNTQRPQFRLALRTRSGALSLFAMALAGFITPHSAWADPSNCVIDGVFQTCTGDQASGIVVRAPIETLTIENLSVDITPATGTLGIDYDAENAATVLSDTGAFSILTTDAAGIRVSSGTGDVYISHSGNVTATNGQGIVVIAGNGAGVVEGDGTIESDLDAVSVDPRGGGAAFNWEGNITSHQASGLFVKSDNGSASAEGNGNISAYTNAVDIDARGTNGDASLRWEGDITSQTGNGVRVYSANGGVSAQGSGDVTASGYGFLLDTKKIGGNSNLNWIGNISSDLSYGVNVRTVGGGSTISGEGTVTSELDGLFAEAIGGNAQIRWAGDVTSAEGYGIFANSPTGGTSIDGSGNVRSKLDGLAATNRSAATANISWTGDVTSSEGRAITVTSTNGASNLRGSGALSGATDGIYIQNLGDSAASLNWEGNINGTTGYGAYVYSATGPASASTDGDITAGNGGIYVSSRGSSNDNVSVYHAGDITAGGVGVEAHSTQAPVSVDVEGDVSAGSYGIYAQSESSNTVSVSLQGAITASGNDGIFAKSSSGIVAINQTGAIQSDGTGVFAESKGANTVSVTRSGDITAAEYGVYAFSSQGIVTVHMSSGNISAGDDGIYARSTGNNAVDVSLVGDVTQSTTAISASSTDGAVYVDTEGDLTSSADTIIAENMGAGEVGVNHNGDITSTAGDGIYARSASGAVTVYQNGGALVAAEHGLHLKGFSDLVAEVGTGASVTGGAGFAGVFMDTGFNNRLTNYGTINNAGGVDDYAIQAEGNNIAVYNYGTVTGNVALGPYANTFINYEGALLETGSVFLMVADDTLTNEGTLSPGSIGQLQITDLTGNLETTATSGLILDLDMVAATDRIDRIDVSGAADLSGTVKLNYLRASTPPQSSTFLTTGDGVTSQTLSLTQNQFVDASIETVNSGKDVQVTINSLDFAPDGLRGNAQSIASYFQRAIDAGGDGVEDVAAVILNAGYDSDAQAIYEDLSPEIALAPLNARYDAALRFADGFMSCPVPSGLNAPLAEGECNWIRSSLTSAQRSSSVAPEDTRTQGFEFAFGMQRAVEMSDWRIAAAAGFTTGSSKGEAGQSTQSESGQIGVAVKYAPGPFVLSAGLSGSWGTVDTTRTVSLGNLDETLVGGTDVSTYNLKLRASYLMQQPGFYLKPQLDMNATLVQSGAYTETGGLSAVAFDGQSETVLSLSPSLEMGRDFRAQSGRVTRAFARVGSTFYSKDGVGISGRLATDVTGADMFTINAGGDKQVLDLSAGVTSFSLGSWSAELGYKGRFSKNLEEHSANLKMRINF